MVDDTSHMLSQFNAEWIKCVLVTPLGGAAGKLAAGLFQTLPHVPLPFADFALQSFPVINPSPEYSSALSPRSPPGKSLNPAGVLGVP